MYTSDVGFAGPQRTRIFENVPENFKVKERQRNNG